MLSRIPAQAAVRPLRMYTRALGHVAGPSPVALGKRPAITARAGPILAIGSSRSLSWTPWKSTPSESAPTEQVTTRVLPETPASATSATSNTVSDAMTSGSLPTGVQEARAASSSVMHEDPSTLLPQPPATDSVPSLEDMVVNSGMSVEEILNSTEAVHAAIKLSDLKLIGLEHGWISLSGWMTDAVVSMHLASGLPWWGSIAATTILIRLCLVPLVVRNLKHNVRLAAIQPQMTALFKRLNDVKQSGDINARNTVIQTLQGLMKQHNVSPFRPLLMPLIQFPFFIGFFNALRHLAYLPLPQLKEGGFGWVTDLTVSDPYYILPITSLLFTNLVLKVGQDGTGAMNNANANMAHFANALQILSIPLIFFIGKMPAAVLFYWTFTNLFTLLQALMLRQPFVKRILNIPVPVVKPPPPGTPAINMSPSYAETWKALKDAINTRREEAMKAAVRSPQVNRQQALKSLPNRVREGKSQAAAGGKQASWLEKPDSAQRKS